MRCRAKVCRVTSLYEYNIVSMSHHAVCHVTYLSVGENDDDVPPQYDILLLYLFCHQVILYEAAVADVGELMAADKQRHAMYCLQANDLSTSAMTAVAATETPVWSTYCIAATY